MPVIAKFEIARYGFIDPTGRADESLPEFARDRETLVALYRAMVLTRTFDEKAVELQRTGRLGTYASSLGQEAVAVGIGSAMRADDVLLPSFREHGTQLLRGVKAEELFLFWGGDERGSCFADAREDFPVSVPVASHAPHAAGVALSFKLRAEPRAAVCVLGDGATSKGDFYEALNVAGAWALPCVFVVVDNAWAISVPRTAQTAAETLAQKAIAAGVEGVQVDGNDVVAVRHALEAALDKARAGTGPTVVEALTYRLADHTTADDASRYRDDEAVGARWRAEPIARLRAHLTDIHRWSRDEEAALIEDCRTAVEKAAEVWLATPPQPATTMFDSVYAALPVELDRQRAGFLDALDDDG